MKPSIAVELTHHAKIITTMFAAILWVRGPDDINWRINATFHRPDMWSATTRATEESLWYHARGYRVHVGPEAPELDVPETIS